MILSYSPFSLSIRFIRLMEIKMITARIMEMALPKFQSPTEINWDSIRFPISMYCPPHRSFGITKEVMARRKTIIIPFTTPGRDSFQITFQKVWKRLAPRS